MMAAVQHKLGPLRWPGLVVFQALTLAPPAHLRPVGLRRLRCRRFPPGLRFEIIDFIHILYYSASLSRTNDIL
jgi:hypothetical protein